MTALLLLVLSATGTIRVQVEGGATEVLAFHRGEPIARAPVRDGVAELTCGEADLVAVGPGVRSELERRVRPAVGAGFDAVLQARPCHRLSVRTEEGAFAYVGGARFPVDAVPLLPGLHLLVVDHPRFVSSVSRLVRVGGDLTIDVPLDAGLVVAGTVFDSAGEPLAKARIDIFADGYATRRSTISDAHGRYAVSGFRGRVVSLRIAAPRHATRLVRVPFEPGSERARVDPSLLAGVSVSLLVTGYDGDVQATLLPRWIDQALEEPRLRANDEPQRKTARGRIAFDGLTPGRTYRILVEAPGFRAAASESFQGGSTKDLAALGLKSAGRLEGKLDGPGHIVVCKGSFGERICRTDRAGRFHFDGVEAGKVVLFVRDVDERGVVVSITGSGTQKCTLKLEAPPAERLLEGTVLDADRKPLAGVRVMSSGRSGVTDKEGAFRIGPMPLGRSRFSLRLEPSPGSRGFAEDPHLPRIEEKARPGIRIRAQLERSGSLDLRFPQARLARATLLLDGTTGLQQQWRMPRGASRMRVDEIPVGDYVVEVGAPGYLGTGGAIAKARVKIDQPIELVLQRGRTVAGHVVKRRGIHREGRAPHILDERVAGGSVTLFDGAAQFALARAPIAPDGSFVLEGLPAAPVLICAAIPGHPIGLLRADLAAKDIESALIPIFAPILAGVQVRVGAKRAVPRLRVSIVNEYGLDVRDIAARARFAGVVADDLELGDFDLLLRFGLRANGMLEHRGLAPGNYEFRVSAPGYEQGVGKVRVRAAWTLAHVGSLLPKFSNPAVPVWLTPKPDVSDEEKPGAD